MDFGSDRLRGSCGTTEGPVGRPSPERPRSMPLVRRFFRVAFKLVWPTASYTSHRPRNQVGTSLGSGITQNAPDRRCTRQASF